MSVMYHYIAMLFVTWYILCAITVLCKFLGWLLRVNLITL